MSRTSWSSELCALGLSAFLFVVGGCSSGGDQRAETSVAPEPATAELGQAINAPESATLAAPGTVPTDANLKVAFVGDTADGSNWKAVADLIKAEGAQAVMVAGDMTYDADPSGWWTATESKFGQTFPVFLARGNHDDSSWPAFSAKRRIISAARRARPWRTTTPPTRPSSEVSPS